MSQLNIWGRDKEQESIRFIKEHEPKEGYFVGISFGKDSTVLYHLVKQAGVKASFYYSCTGLDPPELMRFGHRYFPDVKWLFPKQHFFKELVKRGYPTKFNRWCCDYLKKQPSKDIPLNVRLMGIRAEESFARSQRPQIDKIGKWQILKPIFLWKEWEVWEYLSRDGRFVSPLYQEQDRLGCVVCPFLCGPNSKRLEFHKNRWPKLYKQFEKAMLTLFTEGQTKSIKKVRTELTFEEFLDNWYRGL